MPPRYFLGLVGIGEGLSEVVKVKRKQVMVKRVWPCSVLLVCLFGGFNAVAESNEPMQEWVKPNPAVDKALQFSAIFQGRGDGVHTCPVTGEKLTTKNLKAEYFGRTVYFCCLGCLKSAQRNPEKFVKPTLAEQQHSVKEYIAKASEAPSAEEFCNE